MSTDTLLEWRGPARLEQLPAIVAALESFAAGAGADQSELHDLRLAVEEACVNVMRHGYPGATHAPWIGLRVERSEWHGAAALKVEVRDGGIPFDPLSVAPPLLDASLEERVPGGLGIHLIRAVTDAQQYLRDPAGSNCLVLFKTLATPSRA